MVAEGKRIRTQLNGHAPRLSVRRCLFGKPDPNETEKFLKEQMSIIDTKDSKKWNFDFVNGTPLPGNYEWEPIQTPKTPDMFETLYKKTSRKTVSSKWSVHPDAAVVVPIIKDYMRDLTKSPVSTRTRRDFVLTSTPTQSTAECTPLKQLKRKRKCAITGKIWKDLPLKDAFSGTGRILYICKYNIL